MSKEDKDLYEELEVQVLKLSKKDIEIIMEVLENPKEPNEELVRLAEEFKNKLEENERS